MLGSFRAFPGRVVATAGLGTRLLRRGTEGSFVGGGKIRAIEKCFSQPYILVSPSLSITPVDELETGLKFRFSEV